VTARPTPLAFALATLFAWALFLGVLVDRAELLIAAVPLAVALLSARWPAGLPRLDLRHEISAERLAEGDRLAARVTVNARDTLPLVEILQPLPVLLELHSGSNRIALSLAAGQEGSWTYELICPARGRFSLGALRLRFWDCAGLWSAETQHREPKEVSVYPFITPVRHVPRPLRTQSSFGNYVASRVGEGLEPGEIRPFVPGDRIRRVNWRASLRRGQLYVTQFHEERNADVVLLLDTLSETGARPHSTLDYCVRAGAALAGAYLARKDRVGFIEYGGYLRWLKPATGRRQRENLVEALLPASVYFSYTVKQLDFLPAQVLPPQALVIALSPLLDRRFIDTVLNLAGRGFDLVIIAVSPIEPARWALRGSRLDELALRLWAIEWRFSVDALRRRDLAIIEWRPDTPLDAVLVPFARFRPLWAARR
jgi:uncharacterized protein (DUF58 family)